jgi:hypothetical protein
MAADAVIYNSTETPETDLHRMEVSEKNLEATKAEMPNLNLSEESTNPNEAPKMVMYCIPVDALLVGTETVTLGRS